MNLIARSKILVMAILKTFFILLILEIMFQPALNEVVENNTIKNGIQTFNRL